MIVAGKIQQSAQKLPLPLQCPVKSSQEATDERLR